MFHPSEVELASTTQLILADVERLKPARVVFDSLSELRLLAGTALRYRRQILGLKQFFATRDCTVILLDDMTATDHDLQMQSIAHGVVRLEQLQPDYGAERRRLRIVKYRGVQVPWRLSRLRDSSRRAPGVSATGRGRTPAAHHPRQAAQRDRRTRRAARRRHRRRDQHAHRWRRRNREIDTGGAIRRRGGVSRATRGALHLRREPGHADDPLPRIGRRVAGTRRSRSCHAATGRSRRAHPGRVRASNQNQRRGERCEGDRHRQLEWIPQCDARRAASDDSAARAPDVSRPEECRDDPGWRAPGSHRQPR